MRIVLIGQAAFGEKVLQALTEKGEEIVAVYTTPDTPGKANPLKELDDSKSLTQNYLLGVGRD